MSLWDDSILIPKPRNTRPPTPVVFLPPVPVKKLSEHQLKRIAAERKKHVLKAIEAFTPPSKKPTREIIDEVCHGTGVSMDEMRGVGESDAVVFARYWLMYRLRDERHLSYLLIATLLNKNHQTVERGIRKHAERYGLPLLGKPE